jgi:2-polyprenyl-6-hydroxyphenyl methylase/3-demethylubiquinone-9 3-methyltransferase
MFIDLDVVAQRIAVAAAAAAPNAARVLEIGCGDGALAAALCRAMPQCTVLGIDPGVVIPGKLFDGDPARAEFRAAATSDLLTERVAPFDVVVLCDVIHHVADSERSGVLRDAARLTKPGGTLAFKDWERRRSLAHLATYASDRYVSNDKTVRFMERAEMDALLAASVPEWEVTLETRIPPRWENLLITMRAPEA